MYTLNNQVIPRTNVFAKARGAKENTARDRIIVAIWIYFLLVLFDGALRKWFLPSLSGPLVLLRDPLALWILVTAWRQGYLQFNQYSVSVVIIGFLAIYTAFFVGHGDLLVAVYGSRIFLLHFPMIFVIARVLNQHDILKIGRWTVIISIPMTMLIITQFYSPQTAWINKSVGGEAGGGFSGAMNFFRPPGTFSFTNGTSLFFNLAGCFVIYFWFHVKQIKRYLLVAGSIAILLAIPFSISRTLLFQLVLSLLFAFIAILLNPKYTGGLILIIAAVIGTFLVLSFTPYFTTATAAFTSRFESANATEGGINGVFMDRFLGGLIQAIMLSSDQPFFGNGVGMGTNVGSMLLTGGRQFLIAEGEWGRIIGEIGPIFGLAIVFLRFKIAIKMLLMSLNKARHGVVLPWILSSVGALSITHAGWAQPTSLGFCVITTGLVLASLNNHSDYDDHAIA
jgi:hypothetical protein